MNSFTPTVTITELCDEVVTRDRNSQTLIKVGYETLDKALENQKEDYEIRIDEMAQDISDLEAEVMELDAKLVDIHEDNKFLGDEVYEMNTEMTHGVKTLEALMADYEVIGIHEVDTYADWADRAYEAMRQLSNEFPIVHYATDYTKAFEGAYTDARDMDVDWDDSYYVEDYHDDRWQESWNDNAIEHFDAQEA